MKITNIQFKKMSFRFDEPFHVAFGIIEGYETLVLKLETDEGITGYGEAGPLAFVTGEDLETVQAVTKQYSSVLTGADPLAISRIHEIMDHMYHGNASAKAAVDIACYDIASKKMGVPLWKYLGGATNHITTDVTLSIESPENMALKALDWKAKGFTQLKLKLGEDIQTDIARVRAIRKAVGPEMIIRVDANQGWSVKDAVQITPLLYAQDIELMEQPVADWNLDGLRRIRDISPIPVVADESCHTPSDAIKLIECVDGLNIKLMKCGGIYNAIKINAIAEAAGLFCMIGCMGESKIANAAGMHLAAALPNIQKIDLDVTFFASGSEVLGGYESSGSECILTDKPGLGIEIPDF